MILFKVNSKSSNFCNWFIKNAFQFLGIAALAGFTLLPISSCSDDYDDSEIKDRLDKVEDKVTELEEWCSTVNNEIASLKRLITALENNDYVTGVETLENGYKITFSKSGSITIHNGKDGADGKMERMVILPLSVWTNILTVSTIGPFRWKTGKLSG